MGVPELVKVFKEIQKQPEQIFEMIRLNVREIVGDYMTEMMNAELTRLLAFISLKMELHWRSNPVGKVRNNLPFFKELAYKKFTHKS